MNPREADPNGANSGGGDAGYTGDRDQPASESSSGSSGQPNGAAESVAPGVDETERATITSGIAQTSEVADREAQQDAEGQGDGTPLPR